MSLIHKLSTLALPQILGGVCQALGINFTEGAIDKVSEFLTSRFLDHSGRLPAALQAACARSWSALEVALAGESFWGWLDRAEDRELRNQIRVFLQAVPACQLPRERDLYRRHCMEELRAARQAGLLGGQPDLARLARETADFARFGTPGTLIQAEWLVLEQMGATLMQQGFVNLGHLLSLQPAEGRSLLVLAVRYFFRRAVEEDAKLFKGLAWASWDQLTDAQRQGFEGLRQALSQRGEELDRRLQQLQHHLAGIHGAVLEIQREQQRQGDQHRELYEAVLDLRRRLDGAGAGKAQASPADLEQLTELLDRYRRLPVDQQRQLPALLHDLAQLLLQVGEAKEAEESYGRLDGFLRDRAARAEAHYHSFRAALERQDWPKAVFAYAQATSLDPGRWTQLRYEENIAERLARLPEKSRDLAELQLRAGTPA